jgi:hypothetical protein
MCGWICYPYCCEHHMCRLGPWPTGPLLLHFFFPGSPPMWFAIRSLPSPNYIGLHRQNSQVLGLFIWVLVPNDLYPFMYFSRAPYQVYFSHRDYCI